MTPESIVSSSLVRLVLDPEDPCASESQASGGHTLISGLRTGAELSCEGQHSNSHGEHGIAGIKDKCEILGGNPTQDRLD
jgi:hypothetical protein